MKKCQCFCARTQQIILCAAIKPKFMTKLGPAEFLALGITAEDVPPVRKISALSNSYTALQVRNQFV